MKYKQIAKTIKQDVLNDKYKSDEKIPSEREFADIFGVSKVTIRKALDLLVKNGYIYVKPNSGYYVNEKDIIKSLGINSGLRMHEIYGSSKIKNTVLDFELIRAGEDFAIIFDIKPNDKVVLCSRIRYTDDTIRSIEISYIPHYLVPDMTISNAEVSLYDYIRKLGLPIFRHKKTFHGSFIPEHFLQYVPDMKGVPILLIENYGYLENGSCFEKSYSYCINDEQTIYSDFNERI